MAINHRKLAVVPDTVFSIGMFRVPERVEILSLEIPFFCG